MGKEKKIAYHGRNFKKVDFKAVRSFTRCGLAWFIPLYFLDGTFMLSAVSIYVSLNRIRRNLNSFSNLHFMWILGPPCYYVTYQHDEVIFYCRVRLMIEDSLPWTVTSTSLLLLPPCPLATTLYCPGGNTLQYSPAPVVITSLLIPTILTLAPDTGWPVIGQMYDHWNHLKWINKSKSLQKTNY